MQLWNAGYMIKYLCMLEKKKYKVHGNFKITNTKSKKAQVQSLFQNTTEILV